MYQPITSSNLTVDGDLNLGQYDILAVDGKFDTAEADEFVGGVGNFSSLHTASSLFPKYNISGQELGTPRYTFNEITFNSTANQAKGTKVWFEDVVYPEQRTDAVFQFANLELADYIPIYIFSHETNPGSRYVALYVDGKEVLRTTGQGGKTYNLLPKDFNKVVKIVCYMDKATYAQDVQRAAIRSAYIY
jgi:hypothetical protein